MSAGSYVGERTLMEKIAPKPFLKTDSSDHAMRGWLRLIIH
jgi:hypothetical protein